MKRIKRQLKPTAKANVLDRHGKCAILEKQGHFLRLKMPMLGKAVEDIQRGVITDFSKQSRKRMLETIARIDIDKLFLSWPILTERILTLLKK